MKFFRLFTLSLLALSLMIGCSSTARLEEEITKTNEKISKLDKSIGTIDDNIKAIESQTNELRSEFIKYLELEREILLMKYRKIDRMINKLEGSEEQSMEGNIEPMGKSRAKGKSLLGPKDNRKAYPKNKVKKDDTSENEPIPDKEEE